MSLKLLKWIESWGIITVAIFAPIKGMLYTTLVLIAFDLITGILAAIKRKEPITSSNLRRTLSKLVIYESALMLAFGVEHYLSDIIPFIKTVAGMIALVELKSIYENLGEIGGDPLLKTLAAKIGSENQKEIDSIDKKLK